MSVDEFSKSDQKKNLFLCASGYEERSRYFADHLEVRGDRNVFLGFLENKLDLCRPENDEFYRKNKFEERELSGDSHKETYKILEALLNESDIQDLKVTIDISSMTRAWYGNIIHGLSKENRFTSISVDILYVSAQHEGIVIPSEPNRIFSPLLGFSGLGLANKPTALLLGLGLDSVRAVGIIEEIDPKDVWAFYTDPAADDAVKRKILIANDSILRYIPLNNCIAYPLRNVFQSFHMLRSLVGALINDYRVVIVSLGPKIFGVSSMLISKEFPEVSVWRVSPGKKTEPRDRKPIVGSETILRTIWESESN